MNLTRTSVDGVEPITLDEAKDQCYIPRTNTDTTVEALLNGMITGSREYGENRTWRTLVDSTYEYRLDEFPDGIIKLTKPPVISVTSVEYVDGDGTTQTVDSSDYRVDTNSEPARLEPDNEWPVADDRVNAVIITYKAGYGDNTSPNPDESTVPKDIKIALKMMIKFLYDNRDSHVLLERSGEYHEAPIGTNVLLDQYSVRTP